MSGRTFNRALIIGNVGGEPKFTSTSNSNVPVCTFRVATNRTWTPSGQQEKREETEWHYVVSFAKLAEICYQILTNGTKVFVAGRVQNRELTNDKGEKFKKTEIVASEVIALDKRKQAPKNNLEKETNKEANKT